MSIEYNVVYRVKVENQSDELDTLTRFGNDGWQLIAIREANLNTIYYFSRPKQNFGRVDGSVQ